MLRYRVSTQCAASLPTWPSAGCSRVQTEGCMLNAAVGLLFLITTLGLEPLEHFSTACVPGARHASLPAPWD